MVGLMKIHYFEQTTANTEAIFVYARQSRDEACLSSRTGPPRTRENENGGRAVTGLLKLPAYCTFINASWLKVTLS